MKYLVSQWEYDEGMNLVGRWVFYYEGVKNLGGQWVRYDEGVNNLVSFDEEMKNLVSRWVV